jgi:hypothetical protein
LADRMHSHCTTRWESGPCSFSSFQQKLSSISPTFATISRV